MSAESPEISCRNLDAAIEEHKNRGFRLDMIFPADSPREALMSLGSESIRIVSETHAFVPPVNAGNPDVEWTTGRAGMQYRDLIPGRLGGKVIASHIRLPFGGEVPDSVHYHKIDFQMIYCVRGRIQVVYEDQGPPFWLETGDIVLQPPEIRHRVLYSEAGAEVIEVSSPAEHETWIDHKMELPTGVTDPQRDFSRSRFVRHEPPRAETSGIRDTGIAAATDGRSDVQIRRENGMDTALLLELRGLGAECDGGLSAPVSIEIAI